MEKAGFKVGLTGSILVGLVFLSSGCAGKSAVTGGTSAARSQQVIECPFPDAPTVAAPSWICDEPIPGWQVSAVGSATNSNAGHSMDKEMATAQARDELARSMRVHVQNMIKRFARTTGVGKEGTVDAVNAVVSRQITKETLYGSRVIKSRTSPNGSIYVAVGLDTRRVAENTKEAIQKARSSFKRDEAEYQKIEAEKLFKELDEQEERLSAEMPPTTRGEE